MFKRAILYLKNLDWILFSAALLLICFGLAEIYSVAMGQSQIGGDVLFTNFKKQILFCIIGFLAMFFLAFFDYHNLRSYGFYIYLAGALSLVAVLFFGSKIRGTTGWFNLFGFGIQPVEIVKLCLLLFLARYFSDVSIKINPLRHLLISGGAVLILVLLVLLQPDFGSALLLFAIWFGMIFMVGFKKKYFITIILIGLIASGFAWGYLFKDYQKQRIMTFFQPSFNALDQGYNVAQAIIAVGAGGLTGRGIGFGSQSQLKFLPESQNDFIFAVIAEELGFLGVVMVILFFSIIFWRMITSLKKVNNDFGIYFILGAATLLFIEMFINIGMNIGILPVVGISLPFVSYGGSALISSLMILGVVQSIIIRSKINY